MQEIQKVKKKIALIFAIMAFLFTYCYVMYTKLDSSEGSRIIIDGGNDLISNRLQAIIPFAASHDIYLNAYQNGKVTISDIDNDILLMKAYENSENKTLTEFKEILERLYGNNIFLINRDFTYDDNYCTYNSEKLEYNCEKRENNDSVYNVYRKINRLDIVGNDYTLEEKVIFYKDDNGKITIYTDNTYENEITTLEDSDLEEYYKNNKDKFITYKSRFRVNNSSYEWLRTEKVK